MSRQRIIIWVVLTAIASLAGGCRAPHGKIRIQPLSHVALGQSVMLNAYEEKPPTGFFGGATAGPISRSAIDPVWSVSDSTIAAVDQGGYLSALKNGNVVVKAVWEDREASQNIEVIQRLPAKFVPQIDVQGSGSLPNEISLALTKESQLRFSAHFDDAQDDLAIEAKVPDGPFPWTFSYPHGTVELTTHIGRQVTGLVKNDDGAIAFTVWSNDAGHYPPSLQGKTFIMVGDSMAEGLAWFLREKVEAAGGTFYSEPWYSSTTVQWQADRRMSQLIEKYHPDVVWLALGSNEIFVSHLTSRVAAVRQIDREMGDRQAYWIGPPSWKPDQGIVNVIEANFRPGHFYNANDLNVPRNPDGAHPTRAGFHIWVDQLWDWYSQVG